MSNTKCKNCGSSDIETDPARGDAVCTNCGLVLESNIIVAEVQFQENANGTNTAIGQFVSSETRGGGCGTFGSSFHAGMGSESREITLKKARDGITRLCAQLQLNQRHIDTACNFFKMALSRNLTRGRKNTHVFAACVYITCRIEGTSHLLIDISDVLQICCYELGRTYLRLSQALCINIPSVDPCLYILRFANRLQFGNKTNEVATTALRLVQRMKRDSIHSGRRPSGLCGAALLMAARVHDFNRSPTDIVKIVRVHKTTIQKRLIEFGDTPSSALTLDEFMTIDLEEEQDPPAFKAARKKDKERLQKITENFDQMSDLQKEIDKMLEEILKPNKKRMKVDFNDTSLEENDANKFIEESTFQTVEEMMTDEDPLSIPVISGLGPNIASMKLATSLDDRVENNTTQNNTDDFDLQDLDDDEINSYIMTEDESKMKDNVWNKLNAGYLEEQKEREERLAKEKEDGKPEKKKRRPRKKPTLGANSTAGEAIEKMLQERKLSSKINYDVLKSLNQKIEPKTESSQASTEQIEESNILNEPIIEAPEPKKPKLKESKKKTIQPSGMFLSNPEPVTDKNMKNEKTETVTQDEVEDIDDYYEDEPPTSKNEVGMIAMLNEYRANDETDEFTGFGGYDGGYDEEEY